MIIKNRKIGCGRPLICVSVTAATEDGIRKQFRDLVYEDIDAVEWRADFFDAYSDECRVNSILDEAYGLFKDRVFIFTFRTKSEGGEVDITPAEYEKIILNAAAHRAVDLADCQIKGAQALGYTAAGGAEGFFCKVKDAGAYVLSSCHDFEKTPSSKDILAIADAMQKSGADIIKFAYMPARAEDPYRMMGICRELKDKNPEIPLIFISMGKNGIISRLAGEAFGSCLTFGVADADSFVPEGDMTAGSAPGQLSIDVLNSVTKDLSRAIRSGKKLYLTGFMGAGKSAVSRKLAEITGVRLVDTDAFIEEIQGRSIKDIFASDGQEYFRDAETKALKKLSEENERLIVSCGGGMILRSENADIMRDTGDVIWLKASPATILRRVKGSDSRPVLNGHMNEEYIAGLMEERRQAYEYACTDIVNTDSLLVDEVAKFIKNKYF